LRRFCQVWARSCLPRASGGTTGELAVHHRRATPRLLPDLHPPINPSARVLQGTAPRSLRSLLQRPRRYRDLAITDEASPFALRSTRNRPRTAVRRGAAWTAECHRRAAWLRPWPESRWQCFTAKQLWLPIAARGPASPNPRTAVRDRAASSRWSGMPGRLLRRPAPARAHCLASALRSSRPRSNRPGGRRPVSSRPVSSRPVSSRPVSNRPVSNRPGVRPSGVRRVRPLREPLGGRLSQTWSR
jgi:hypothetical protein